MILLNAFSFNMVKDYPVQIHAKEASLEEARALVAKDFKSAVGHADTANVFASQLGTDVPANRVTVALEKGDTALVGQYRGPRLPEGASELPEGATIQWLLIDIR